MEHCQRSNYVTSMQPTLKPKDINLALEIFFKHL